MKLLLSTALAVLFACGYALANCAPSTVAVSQHQQWGQVVIETRTMTGPGAKAEGQWRIWLNSETGEWSLTVTVGATTCLVRSGENYANQTIVALLTEART